jgi:hypothetical protein
MARIIRPEYDTPEFERRYLSGESDKSLAEWVGTTVMGIQSAVKRRNLAKKRRELLERRAIRKAGNNPPDLVRAYMAIHFVLARGR